MRRSMNRVSILAVLAVGSALVANSMISREHAVARSAPGQGAFEQLKRVRVDRPAAGIPRNDLAQDPPVVRSGGTFDQMSVVPNAFGFDVSASITLMDRGTGNSYMWTVSIRDPLENNEVSGLNYDGRIFSFASPEPKTITFEDSLQVDPGSYTVEVKLWSVRAGLDIASLRAEGRRHPDMVLGGARKVEVRL